MVPQRYSRRVIRQPEQARRLVDRKTTVVGGFRAGATFESIFVHGRGPVTRQVEARSRTARTRGRASLAEAGLAEHDDSQQHGQVKRKCSSHRILQEFIEPSKAWDSNPWRHSVF